MIFITKDRLFFSADFSLQGNFFRTRHYYTNSQRQLETAVDNNDKDTRPEVQEPRVIHPELRR